MDLRCLIEALAKELKVDIVSKKDENGEFQLQVPSLIPISVKELEPGVFISAKILDLPDTENRESLYVHLMSANLLGKKTGGGAIGIDPLEKYLTLSFSCSCELTYEIFRDKLEDFFNIANYWKEVLLQISSPT